MENKELTWQDVRRIVEIADGLMQTALDEVNWQDKGMEAYYTEVLQRYKEEKQ